MTCPKCKGPAVVIDTRPFEKTVRRRRECLDCGHRFTTYEYSDVEKTRAEKEVKKLRKIENFFRLYMGGS